MNGELHFGGITKSLKDAGKKIISYRALLFFILLAAIYGFIVYRINSLSGIAPDDNAVPATTKTTQPHVDPDVVKKILDLQDNSVNVQTLFDQARQNPFQE
jgi:hypothetical protein